MGLLPCCQTQGLLRPCQILIAYEQVIHAMPHRRILMTTVTPFSLMVAFVDSARARNETLVPDSKQAASFFRGEAFVAMGLPLVGIPHSISTH
jgi:hypothetical protein